MTLWREPAWTPAQLTPARLFSGRGFVLSAREVTARGVEAGKAWRDRVASAGPPAVGAWVLVGGAGFLGARIAAQLLDAPGPAAVVIVSREPSAVRARWAERDGDATAERRMRDTRLRMIHADLRRPDLGWAAQVPVATVIVHLAAEMDALAGWSRLRPANLDALAASVALARRDGALLQLASSLSVLVSSNAARADAPGPLAADEALWLHGGYAQTKAAAEAALASCGLERWQVVRYGLLTPEPSLPFPPGHFAPIFASALRAVGVPGVAERAMVDLTPVEAAAAAAIRLARSAEPGWTHWANVAAASLAEVVGALEDSVGHLLAVTSRETWLSRVAALPALPRALLRAAFDKSAFLQDDAARGPVLNVDLFQSTHRRFVAPGAPGASAPPASLLPGVAASMLRVKAG